ncbi:hypothetical protein [Parasutterella sp.]|uniref:hypothetical protein n=1 Tax=Parasutterella sp. TaxID=2049037 RepID=UPI00351FC279
MKLIRTAACLAALGLAVCTAVDARPPGPPSGGPGFGPGPGFRGPGWGRTASAALSITIIDGTISEETSLAEHWCSA